MEHLPIASGHEEDVAAFDALRYACVLYRHDVSLVLYRRLRLHGNLPDEHGSYVGGGKHVVALIRNSSYLALTCSVLSVCLRLEASVP